MPFQKGNKIWLGRKHTKISKMKMSIANRGKHYSPKTEFKKGMTSWCKGRKNPKVASEKHYKWKGGKIITYQGYAATRQLNRPITNAYLYEHRLVMEKKLGRHLSSKEHIHHINGIKTDNRLKNLWLFPSRSAHISYEKNVSLTYKKWGIKKSDSDF